ncbi:MAG: hypothetical protein IPK16_23665 [Anaerolineales bacterium]|nr:hypothetical protein [Anaerolineales bacterium]
MGHATATAVIISDTLDLRAQYISGTARLAFNGGAPAAVTPVTVTNQLTVALPSLAPGDTYLHLRYQVGAIGDATPCRTRR